MVSAQISRSRVRKVSDNANTAAAAFAQWSQTSAEQRAEHLRAMSAALDASHRDLTELAATEIGASPLPKMETSTNWPGLCESGFLQSSSIS